MAARSAPLTIEEISELTTYFLDPDTYFQMTGGGMVIAKLKDGRYTAAMEPRTLLQLIQESEADHE